MSRRVLVVVAAILAVSSVAACSLLVSTSGLSVAAAPAAPGEGGTATDAGAPAADASFDAPDTSTGVDASEPNVIARYSFEDAPGLVARDTSGNGRDAVLAGDATFVDDGAHGHALAVAGTGSMVVTALAGSAAFPPSGTLSFWFRYSFPTGEMVERSIFDKWDSTRHHLFVRRGDTATGTDFQAAAQVTNSYAFATSFNVVPGTWAHCVLTWDAVAKSAAFYLNGGSVAAGPYDIDFDVQDQHFRMGEGLIGGIDEVRLYDRVLTAVEVGKLE
jgi:hypothetical protein